jgi:hypothetical protein
MSNAPNPNRAARSMAKLRWANTSPRKRQAHVKMMAKARWAGKTDAERLAHVELMNAARKRKAAGQ